MNTARRPSDRFSTSWLAMFIFVVWITAVEAAAVAIAGLVFDMTGNQKFVLGLTVFLLAAYVGYLVLKRLEQRPDSQPGLES